MADDLKTRGNEAFAAGKFQEAVDLYAQALILVGSNNKHAAAVLHSNRSAAYLGLKDLDAALSDAEQAIELRPQWGKGYYRKGCCLEEQAKEKPEALRDAWREFRAALDIEPMNDELTKKVREIGNKLKSEGRHPSQQQGRGRGVPKNGAAARMGFNAGNMPPAAKWAVGLSKQQQYEWFTDCYRMRVDDNYAIGGGELYGLYSAVHEISPIDKHEKILEDFLVFCKLAVRNDVVPPDWDWWAFLTHAAGDIVYAFEKSDAQEKYGSENVFAVLTGGRSLRYTAECVYGFSAMAPQQPTAEYEHLQSKIIGRWWMLSHSHADLFDDVGGIDAWTNAKSLMPYI